MLDGNPSFQGFWPPVKKVDLRTAATAIVVAALALQAVGCGQEDPVAPAEPAISPLASTLEGEARAAFEEMTPRQQQAMAVVVERLGPERTTGWLLASPEQKARILPLQQDPGRTAFAETLGGDALALYERLDERGRADLELFADALGHDAAMSSLLVLGEREREWTEWNASISPPERSDGSGSPLPSGVPSKESEDRDASAIEPFDFYAPGFFSAPLPPMRDALSPGEQAKLDSLDPRIRAPFVESWLRGGVAVTAPDPTRPGAWLAFIDPKAYVDDGVDREAGYRKNVLMSIPAEFPPIEDLVLPEMVARYEALHPDLKEEFWIEVAMAYGTGMTVGRPGFGPLTDEDVRRLFTGYLVDWSEFQAMTPKYRRQSQ